MWNFGSLNSSNFVKYHLLNIPAKFGSYRVSAFGGEDKNMNSLQTTKDTVMTTAREPSGQVSQKLK